MSDIAPAHGQEYVEREDEFDINPREEGAPAGAHANGDASAAAAGAELDDADDDDDVDIVTGDAGEPAGDPFAEGVSSDEECMGDWGEAGGQPRRPLHHLPLEVQRQASPAPACAPLPCLDYSIACFSLHLSRQNMGGASWA